MSSLRRKLGRKATEDDLFSSLMYPKVFDDFQDFRNKYGGVSVLPTTAYFHGLEPGEEISVDIEEGKPCLSNCCTSVILMKKEFAP